MTTAARVYLDAFLAPLAAFLGRDDVTDLLINRPGEVWLETGGATERHDVPELTDAALWRLARQVAAAADQGISREHPLLAATLPDGARVQICAPPATRGHVIAAIRKHNVPDLRLADYGAAGAFARVGETALSCVAVNEALARRLASGDTLGFLQAAVQAHVGGHSGMVQVMTLMLLCI